MRLTPLPKMAGAAGRQPKGYPVKEIRDFINHLLWEARIAHFEATSAPGTFNPELADELRPYASKYGGVLWPTRSLDPDGLPEADVQRALAFLREKEAKNAGAVVEALEAALPAIERALEIHANRTVPIFVISAKDVLKIEASTDPDPDA